MSLILSEILIVLALILANGVFSMAELAVISARQTRLKQRALAGSRGARVALQLSEDPNRLLSTVQVGITLVGTLAGVVGGATIGDWLSEQLLQYAWAAPYADAIGLGVVVVGIAYATLVLGELVPKRIALGRPESLAIFVSIPLKWISILTTPVIKVLSASTNLVLWLLRIRDSDEPAVTEDDIKLLMREGHDAGVFEQAEQEMILRVFRLTDRRAGSLMTPRNEIIWIDVAESPDEIRDKIRLTPHTSFPVCDGSLDNMLGVVRVKDLLVHGFAEHGPLLKGRIALPLFLYEGTRGPRILEAFRKSGQHFAVVLDEYGSVEGVLTLTDILEAIIGDLPRPDTTPEPRAVQREDGSWLLDGTLSTEEFGDLINHPPLPRGDYHTLAGFLITRLGHIPKVAETFEWENLRFEVVDMDANRVDRVLVSFLNPRD